MENTKKEMTQNEINSMLIQNSIENKAFCMKILQDNIIMIAMLNSICKKLDIPISEFEIPDNEKLNISDYVSNEIDKINLLIK